MHSFKLLNDQLPKFSDVCQFENKKYFAWALQKSFALKRKPKRIIKLHQEALVQKDNAEISDMAQKQFTLNIQDLLDQV